MADARSPIRRVSARRWRILPLLLALAACHPPTGRLSGPGEPLLPCLRAETRSRLLRFVDDVQVVVDDRAKVVRFRSASRVGHSGLGVDRERMRRFGERFRALDAERGR